MVKHYSGLGVTLLDQETNKLCACQPQAKFDVYLDASFTGDWDKETSEWDTDTAQTRAGLFIL